MDLLSQYKNDRPQESVSSSGGFSPDDTTPTLIRRVIRLSGGTLDTRQANYVLLGIAVLAGTIALILFIRAIRGSQISTVGKNVPLPGSESPR